MLKTFLHIAFFSLLAVAVHAQQTEKIYLSGTGSPDAKQWQFFCTSGMNANKWTAIAVPSCWELQGFGKYDYGFAKDSVRGKEQGLYKYNFSAAAAWKNKKINIVFEGVMTDAEVKINGQPAGEIHQGAFYTFKYDITKLLKYGEQNLLEVTVSKHSSNQSVNEAERRADFWIFGGIFRPVWLEVLPIEYIKNVKINAQADGNFKTEFRSNSIVNYTAVVNIYDAAGKWIDSLTAGDYGSATSLHIASKNIKNIINWTPENPARYTAEFIIYKNGKPVHIINEKFGFRTVEVKQRDGIYVNGVKVKMKGVNRAPFRPETGRTLSKQNSIEDVLLIKDMNMNAVRCSHYPPDEHFLDACDSLGLFVMDELAGWHGNYDTKTGTKLLKEMIDHDENHPSIIMWANGNEGGHNLDLDKWFTEFDLQKRPVVHPWQLFNGIETQHYREYNYGIGNYENGREIVMPTEFLHGQFDGGHGAGLEDYWEEMWSNPLGAGGFLWDFADQAVVRKDKNDSLDTDKFRAADGIVGPHQEKEGSYYAIKEIWSPVYFERKEITPQFDGFLWIQNRYHFTNLMKCRFSYSLKQFELPITKENISVVASPDIPPGARGSIKLSLPANWKEYDALYVTVKDWNEQELFTWSLPIHSPKNIAERVVVKEGKDKIQIPVADTTAILVHVKDVQLMFNEVDGTLMKVKNKNGLIPFNNGPVIQEGANNFRGIKRYFEGDNYIIESTFDKKESYNTLKWTIYPSGWIELEVNYFPGAYFTNFAGVNFSFPEKEIKSVTYMGNGPYRVWKNRMKGNRFGVWNKTYNNTETGESCIYPEFKGYHSNMYWCKFIGSQNSFTVFTENEDMFLRLFTPAWKTDQWHNYEPLFPSGDISFMQGISSIGSKTQRNETTGPMGMKNIFYDYEKDPSRALKMVMYFNFNN
jgi:Glycosyl hydrolases family 2, TIM barrel domain/Glycosyl hydrolases family 2, sugar binding domain/Beta galactosidase small chain/Glycosyl hydrolases family 2